MILQLTVGLYAPANRADVHGCSGSMLIQAIRSHIHFSQLSAWLSRSKGSIPSHVIYRSVLKPYQSDVTNKLNTVSLFWTLSICMKKPVFLVGNKMELAFPLEIFWKKWNTSNVRGIPLCLFLPEWSESYHFHTIPTLFPWWNTQFFRWEMKLNSPFHWKDLKCCQMGTHSYCLLKVFPHKWKALIVSPWQVADLHCLFW